MRTELELYIHIPFCVRKCAYCDFLSGPATAEVQEQYLQRLLQEIASFPYKEEYEVSTVFFGGGTPSIFPAEWIAQILDALRENFRFADQWTGSLSDSASADCGAKGKHDMEDGSDASVGCDTGVGQHAVEVTIECNPGTADLEKLRAYRRAGINRISFGLQSAENTELALLGRIHTWETFLQTYEAARQAGFSNINVDLMSALPGQSVESWERTLRRVLELDPEHISAYSLIIEEGTPFYSRYHADDERRACGEQPEMLPSEDAEREMYRLTEKLLREHGLLRYEISNYAKAGHACRHNIGYWTGVEYAGFGLGASSLLHHTRLQNTVSLEAYLASDPEIDRAHGGDTASAADTVSPTDTVSAADTDLYEETIKKQFALTGSCESAEPLTVQEEMEEFMFLGLRLICGVSEEEFARRFGRTLMEVYGPALERLCAQNLLVRENGNVFLSAEGLDLSNTVMAEFLF